MTEEKVCCPKFDPTPWENQEIVWDNKMFVKDATISFWYVPLNIGAVTKRTWGKIEEEKAAPDMKDWIMLSKDVSPWKCEQYLAATKEVPGVTNVKISGTFLSKVFEGPYKDAKNWHKEMQALAKEKGVAADIYFYYTTCPKCAKKWGKNYVVGMLKIK